ncbi:expressed protein, partial [Phakopsora pachyrhizi]
MILLLFNEMKLLAFIGDFFTPMLPLLLFFYSSLHYSLLLCPASLPCFFSFSSLSCTFCSSVLYPCAFLILFWALLYLICI